jgi:hypothetical protein
VRSITLHIERLVLDGLPIVSGGSRQVRETVEAELSRQLSRGGLASLLQSGGIYPDISAPAVRLDGGAGPSTLGRQIANAVYGGIGV